MPSEFLRLFFWKISVFKKLILLTVTSLFLILPIKTAHSQVIIKERVSINPIKNPLVLNSASAVSSYYLPCGPYPEVEEISCSDIKYWEVLWYGDSSSIGLNQHYCEDCIGWDFFEHYPNLYSVVITD